MISSIRKHEPDRLVIQVYNQILEILSGSGLSSREKINAAVLADYLHVSRTPVNIALHILEAEGFVERTTNGWISKPLLLDDVRELLDIKEQIFPLMVKKASENISSENSVKLIILTNEIERALQLVDVNSWRSADLGFNNIIGLSSNYPRLHKLNWTIDSQLYRIRMGSLSITNPNKEVIADYRNLANAITSEKEEFAANISVEFVAHLRMSLMKVMKEIITPLLGDNSKFNLKSSIDGKREK